MRFVTLGNSVEGAFEVPSPLRGEGQGEGGALLPDVPETRNPLTGPAGHPLPAFGGPKVRLSRQRKLRLRVSRGERAMLLSRQTPTPSRRRRCVGRPPPAPPR
ncbi:hypothetical protein C1S70_22135 (plasmid) [Azospirillum argentinense]|uniref:Uncharacterized protein n=1 Tax=Azospirillum argentinense TaxID=2970906 RepID=A0A2K1FW66_9PROT|nr:hypothetical protein C1S70_22135 [Azospirillum argentinense]